MRLFAAKATLPQFLVRARTQLFVVVLILTAVLAWYAPGLQLDPTMKSGVNPESPEYEEYRRFTDLFGYGDYILLAIKIPDDVSPRSFLKTLDLVTRNLQAREHIVEVVSLTSFAVFQERDGEFGTWTLARKNGGWSLPSVDHVDRLRKNVPVLDLLVSDRLDTFGLLVKIAEESRFDTPFIDRFLKSTETMLRRELPKGSTFKMIGGPVLRHAIQGYSVETAITFGLLCFLVSNVIAVYIFKSFKVTILTLFVIGVSVVWIVGLMSLAGIPLNPTTGLSFGLVLAVSVAAMIHIVTHFNERYREVQDPVPAMEQALGTVARPCLMCALTTSTGFASIMVSTIPMVRQLGLIMALGVLLAYVLAVVSAPTLLIWTKPPTDTSYRRMSSDWLAYVFERFERFVFARYHLCFVLGLVVLAIMIVGIPRIRSDTQLLRLLSESTEEVQAMRFVERNLASIHSVELFLEAEPETFRQPDTWERVNQLRHQLLSISEVTQTESLLSVLAYLNEAIAGTSASVDDLFRTPGLLTQLTAMISFTPQGTSILDRFVTDEYDKARITVRIKNSPSVPIGRTIGQIRQAAEDALGPGISVHVTGDLAVFQAQSADLVKAQTYSLIIALSCITVLMILQFRFVLLGLLSLIPNLMPLAVIFGCMGWLGISLDSVTVFAATVSIGLSVDDTIHYLTQLKREITVRGREDTVEMCLRAAYRTTGKALMSTSAVLFAGFLMLFWSPFQPVTAFGYLGCAAICTALLADLGFMPAFILTIGPVERLVARKMAGT